MAVLEVRNVKKVFGDNVILRGMDLDVQKGNVIVILGPSGSGKTTFLRCLNLLEKPDEGSMVLNGREYNLKNVKNKEKFVQFSVKNKAKITLFYMNAILVE